jgi:hypothetical protein
VLILGVKLHHDKSVAIASPGVCATSASRWRLQDRDGAISFVHLHLLVIIF